MQKYPIFLVYFFIFYYKQCLQRVLGHFLHNIGVPCIVQGNTNYKTHLLVEFPTIICPTQIPYLYPIVELPTRVFGIFRREKKNQLVTQHTVKDSRSKRLREREREKSSKQTKIETIEPMRNPNLPNNVSICLDLMYRCTEATTWQRPMTS